MMKSSSFLSRTGYHAKKQLLWYCENNKNKNFVHSLCCTTTINSCCHHQSQRKSRRTNHYHHNTIQMSDNHSWLNQTASIPLSLSLRSSSSFTSRQSDPMNADTSECPARSDSPLSSSSSTTSTTPSNFLSLPPIVCPKNPTSGGAVGHRIVFMRHGESAFNNANIFTGWCDVSLTPRGIVEAIEVGEVFRSYHLHFSTCYTSLLTRSIVTAHQTLAAGGISYTPIVYDWRLNERHYGALQGLSKDQIADQVGKNIVMNWRRSFSGRPPQMTNQHPHYNIIQNDIRYQHVQDQIPKTESLQDCQIRVMDVYHEIIEKIRYTKQQQQQQQQQSQQQNHFDNGTTTTIVTPQEVSNNNSKDDYTLIVAHANTLRALIMYIDNISEEDIESINIPTAIPFYYDIDINTGMKLSSHPTSTTSNSSQNSKNNKNSLFHGIYISDERKKRNFLERRRAANDPWLWALHDDQVSRSMLRTNDTSDNGTVTAPVTNDEKNIDKIIRTTTSTTKTLMAPLSPTTTTCTSISTTSRSSPHQQQQNKKMMTTNDVVIDSSSNSHRRSRNESSTGDHNNNEGAVASPLLFNEDKINKQAARNTELFASDVSSSSSS